MRKIMVISSALARPLSSSAAALEKIDFPNRGNAAPQTPFLRGVKPLHVFELLGDEHLAHARKAEAADPYRNPLAAAPNRRLSVLGLKAATSS